MDAERKPLVIPCEDPFASFKLLQAVSATSETWANGENRGLFPNSFGKGPVFALQIRTQYKKKDCTMSTSSHSRPPSPPTRWVTGYCTNVHSGVDLEAAQANLLRYAVPVQKQLNAGEKLPVGLWLAEPAAQTLQQGNQISRFREWLEEHSLLPFTFNGFPQGDFHQPVVKHRVYLPTWETPERRDYTLLLIDHLHALLPVGEMGSISTLPLGWGMPKWSEERLQMAAAHLQEVADYLRQLEEKTGRRIVLAIEPEPGCALHTSHDMTQFFSQYLSGPGKGELNRRYLTVCHDICHAAVMFESQSEFFDRIQAEGLLIGKVQVSAALEARWSELDVEQRRSSILFLKQFAEDRYLHQTGVRSKLGFKLWEDLPQLLAEFEEAALDEATWRIHFHVPICESEIGELYSTQPEIKECLRWLDSAQYQALCPTRHLEVETYAWSVIPAHLRQNDLAASIASEIRWLRDCLTELR